MFEGYVDRFGDGLIGRIWVKTSAVLSCVFAGR